MTEKTEALALTSGFSACSSEIRNAKNNMLSYFGEAAYSDVLMRVAKDVAMSSGMNPKVEMGCFDSVRDLHPRFFSDDYIVRFRDDAARIDVDQLRLLTPAEKLAFAATGSYDGAKSSCPANMIQLFGPSFAKAENDPIGVWCATLDNIARELKNQIQEEL